jgi:ribose/xylose/arabinose/galactoside ABC-type transport system permease subunit
MTAFPTLRRQLTFATDALVHYAIVFVLIALVVAASILYPGFLTVQNLENILSQNTPTGIIAVGMTFVIIAGGFDLSVGAIAGMGATFYASFALQGSLPVAAGIAMLSGIIVGSANGYVINRLRVNPFVATLGASSAISGLILIYSNTRPYVVSDSSFQFLAAGEVGPFPVPIIVLAIIFLSGGFLLSRTKYGRIVYAIGGNAEAAHLSGIRVELVRTSTYALSGLLSAFAGILIAARLGVGQANQGANMPLDAIAIVVVGGTSLLGGEGAIWRTFVGLLVFATLTNLFYGLDVDSNWQLVAKGSIIIAAVALDSVVRKTS